MSGILVNWQSNRAWSEKDVHQLKSKNAYITEGSGYSVATKKFKVDFHRQGSMFPRANLPLSAVQSSLYVLAFPYHKVGMLLGKLGLGAFESIKTKKPAIERFQTAGKDAAFVAGAFAVSWILGESIYSYLSWGATALAISYAVYDPKGMKIYVADLEERINTPSLRDNEILDLTDWKKIAPKVLEGSYSLSRILNMHRIGNIEEKIGDEPRFKTIEKKKE